MAIPFNDYVNVKHWVESGIPVIIVTVAAARGSTPRAEDAFMAVTADAAIGTIGGGRLEWIAVKEARSHLGSSFRAWTMEVPLGPQIGQCCGGHVTLAFETANAGSVEALGMRLEAEHRAMPLVLIFGAGHTGRALANALAPLPFRTRLIDSREDLPGDGLPASIKLEALAIPESAVRAAAPGTAFLAMTHSHDLDFLIVAEALARGDAAYVGMIGSATKRAVFGRWLDRHGYAADSMAGLTCPIGGSQVRDKRPAVIAALTAAELLYIAGPSGEGDQRGASTRQGLS